MTSISALCKVFLQGKTISIKNAYLDYGISNIAREVGRSIERKFGLKIDKKRKEGTSRYGQSVTWNEYHLNRKSPCNFEGIDKMREYIKSQKK